VLPQDVDQNISPAVQAAEFFLVSIGKVNLGKIHCAYSFAATLSF